MLNELDFSILIGYVLMVIAVGCGAAWLQKRKAVRLGNAEKDKMGSLADPTYERWIKHTDPCQDPLPDADGIWSMMDRIVE